jgi:hypothetical protein
VSATPPSGSATIVSIPPLPRNDGPYSRRFPGCHRTSPASDDAGSAPVIARPAINSPCTDTKPSSALASTFATSVESRSGACAHAIARFAAVAHVATRTLRGRAFAAVGKLWSSSLADRSLDRMDDDDGDDDV